MGVFSDKDIKQLREILKRLDGIDGQLGNLQKLLIPFKYLPPELERAVRAVGRRAEAIDKQVPDLE